MKQTYTHKELLSLRHECQEPSVRAFFSSGRPACVFSDFAPKLFNPYAGHTHEHAYGHSLGSPRRLSRVKYENTSVDENITNAPRWSTLNKSETRPLESYQLVKIPPSLGELPPGSRIIKVRHGAPVPENAIAISVADILGASGAKHPKKGSTPTIASRFWSEKANKNKTSNVCNVWDIDYETRSHDGVTNFAAGDKSSQIYDHATFAPTAGAASEDTATVVDAGTKPGPATRTSSGTWASTETKFHYARFFEPYMRKFSGDVLAEKSKGPENEDLGNAVMDLAPRRSCESDSATEYSSDSSNIQIQLPA